MNNKRKNLPEKAPAKPERCSYCGQRMEERVLNGVQGVAGGVMVRFKEYPVLSCPANHDRREIYPGFNPELLDSLFNDHRELFAVRKGLVKKRQCCPRCGEALGNSPVRRCTIELLVRTKQGNQCSLKLSGEFAVCPGCRLTLIENEGEEKNQVAAALAHLFEKEKVKGWEP